MVAQRPINSNDTQLFDSALRQKKPIERIARRRFRFERPYRMAMIDREQIQTYRFKEVRQIVERKTRIDFPKASFDRDFPQAGRAREQDIFFSG